LNTISEVNSLIEKTMQNKVIEVIGVDLGDGDTAISKLPMESDASPERLQIDGKKKQITAIGFEPDGKVAIGEKAILSKIIRKLHINFKEKPTSSNYLKLEDLFKPYIKEIYRLLLEKPDIRGGEYSLFVVGCPSGWEEKGAEDPPEVRKERDLYKELLKIDDIPIVKVISESRAAFINAKESAKFRDYKYGVTALLSAVLIIDIGSSTTDFTLVRSLRKEPHDFGANQLGASLIDEAIFAFSVAKADNRQEIEQAFKQDSSLERKCKLACRRAKERCFSEEYFKENQQQEVEDCDLNIGKNLYFHPVVSYDSLHEQILQEHQSTLDDKGWQEYFEDKLRRVKTELQEEGTKIGVLLMTGGASRMEFTRKTCKQVFDAIDISEVDAESSINDKSILYFDSEPEHCIADGLARVGRWDLRSQEFIEEVKAFIEQGEVKTIVLNHISQLINWMAETLSDDIINNVVITILKYWQKGEIKTFEDAEAYASDLIQERLKDEEVKSQIREQCRNWLNSIEILGELSSKTQAICREYKIEESGLDLRVNIDPNLQTPAIPLEDVIGGQRFSSLVSSVTELIGNIFLVGGWIATIITAFTQWWLLLLSAIFNRPIRNFIQNLADGLKVILNDLLENIRQKGIDWLIKEDVPLRVRSWILSDEAIIEQCESKRLDLTKQLTTKMKEEEGDFSKNIVQMVGDALEKALIERAEIATILIK
jgi:molecular chaperone DnaK (HSP70)